WSTDWTNSNQERPPQSELEKHLASKLLAVDDKRDENRYYIGLALGEYYNINPDYNRTNKEKIFFHLPYEYDCCSKCKEDFPHRVHYSEQSFQEELSDNYRIFLPNNYRDLDGETGEITNLFKINNNLFVHTREGLWQMPKNYQERVTNQIVSFIGTGSYFEIPPQKIVDDDTGNSAGLQHKFGAIKTPNGYFFVCENQNTFYKFDGQKLTEISSQGMYNWFYNNIPLKAKEEYYKLNFKNYPYDDNVSNKDGIGFISTYDSKKERIILTKKDFILNDVFNSLPDCEVCSLNENMVYFTNYQQIISDRQNNGWTYLGLENCKMKFSKDVEKTKLETSNQLEKNCIITVVPEEQECSPTCDDCGKTNCRPLFKNIDYLVFKYNFSDGRDLDTSTELTFPTLAKKLGWKQERDCVGENKPDYIKWGGDNTGTGVESVCIYVQNIVKDFPNSEDVIFKAAAWWYGTKGNNEVEFFAIGYKGGTMFVENFEFKNRGGTAVGNYTFPGIKVEASHNNITGVCDGTGVTSLGEFKYNINTGDLTRDGISGGGQTIPKICDMVCCNYTTTVITSPVKYIDTIYEYVIGTPINPAQSNNSWTISYSLKENYWVSFHSYLPQFYINTPQNFLSWLPTNNNAFWKHNTVGIYQMFYGTKHPFIIDYIALSNSLSTKVWDFISLLIEAKKFITENNEYVDVDVLFNKVILYNSKQCSGLLNIKVKADNPDKENYLHQQITNLTNNEILADRKERTWHINNFRDIRVDYTKPIFNSNINSLQSEYFIDKKLNESSLNYEKDWTQLESFRDKYLGIRVIFDSFADVKLLLNISGENETNSFR
ncbi:MAG: hypothetical protein ACRC0V_11215, partial [Fusobacteriaceae bacterium]|uniref:hypothetical protein n=1 Tax=Romboutsia sp. TaxID=1965302 RepID=UPI003F2D7BCF